MVEQQSQYSFVNLPGPLHRNLDHVLEVLFPQGKLALVQIGSLEQTEEELDWAGAIMTQRSR